MWSFLFIGLFIVSFLFVNFYFLKFQILLKSYLLIFLLGIYIYIIYVCLNHLIFLFWFDGVIFVEYNFFVFNGSLDSLSLFLVFLTAFIYLISFFFIWNVKFFWYYFFLINLLFIFLFNVFFVHNLLLFYFFFEATLIPMYIIIGFLGTRLRKITAAYRFFLYTFLGSIFFFSLLFYFFYFFGTFNFFSLIFLCDISVFFQKMFWLFAFITFAVKMPLYPFHTWLPEAHSEAPTVGSIILASILLKLGPYGIIKFINPLFTCGLFFFRPLLYVFCFLGLYYTAISAIRQLDIKRIIAYSSIGHMSLVMLGILMYNFEGYLGAFILIIAHGFVSGGLFLIVGFIYERYSTRNLIYFGSLVQINPLLACISFLLLLGNFAFPGTLNFIAEIFIFIGSFTLNTYICVLCIFSSVFVLSYNLFFFSRIFYGIYNEQNFFYNVDLSFRELILSICLIFPIFFFGLYPLNFYLFIDKFIYYLLTF